MADNKIKLARAVHKNPVYTLSVYPKRTSLPNEYLLGVATLGNIAGNTALLDGIHIRRVRPVIKTQRLRVSNVILAEMPYSVKGYERERHF